jgi:hypothetical protein
VVVVVVVVREYLFVYDTQIECQQMPTLDLDIVGHSTDSMDSVLVEFEFHSKFHQNCFVNFAGPSA